MSGGFYLGLSSLNMSVCVSLGMRGCWSHTKPRIQGPSSLAKWLSPCRAKGQDAELLNNSRADVTAGRPTRRTLPEQNTANNTLQATEPCWDHGREGGSTHIQGCAELGLSSTLILSSQWSSSEDHHSCSCWRSFCQNEIAGFSSEVPHVYFFPITPNQCFLSFYLRQPWRDWCAASFSGFTEKMT